LSPRCAAHPSRARSQGPTAGEGKSPGNGDGQRVDPALVDRQDPVSLRQQGLGNGLRVPGGRTKNNGAPPNPGEHPQGHGRTMSPAPAALRMHGWCRYTVSAAFQAVFLQHRSETTAIRVTPAGRNQARGSGEDRPTTRTATTRRTHDGGPPTARPGSFVRILRKQRPRMSEPGRPLATPRPGELRDRPRRSPRTGGREGRPPGRRGRRILRNEKRHFVRWPRMMHQVCQRDPATHDRGTHSSRNGYLSGARGSPSAIARGDQVRVGNRQPDQSRRADYTAPQQPPRLEPTGTAHPVVSGIGSRLVRKRPGSD